MKKYFFSIIVVLLCLLTSRPAEARLTLGVMIDPGTATGGLSRDQVSSLAGLLSDRLQETVSIKELPDSVTLVNWLDQFAAVDMALLPTAEVAAYKGRFLLIGPLDQAGQFTLVARQGISGDLAEKAAALVRESGFSPWRATVTEGPPPVAERASPAPTIDKVIAAQVLPEVATADKSAPEPLVERGRSDELVAVAEPRKTRLVLAVIPALGGALQTTAQAEELAAYLGSVLPVAIHVKPFDTADNFVEWFMRYRMIDLALVVPGFADTRLGRDYRPLVGLSPVGGPREAVADLLIVRHDLDKNVTADLQTALLGMMQSAAGQAVLARLPVGQITDLAGGVPPAVVEPVEPPPAPPLVEPAEEPLPGPPEEVAEIPPAPVEYGEPDQPEAPVVLALPDVPILPEMRVPGDLPPEPASPDLIPALPVGPRAPEPPGFSEMVAVTIPPQPPERPETTTPPGIADVPVVSPPIVPAEPEVVAPEVPSLPVVSPPDPPAQVVVADEPVAPTGQHVEMPATPEIDPPPVADVLPPVVAPATPERPAEAAAELAVTEPAPAVDVSMAIPEEVMPILEPVPSGAVSTVSPVVDDGLAALKDDDIIALLGEDSVAAIVSQPDIPQELRPPGVPVLRPGRVTPQTPAVEEGLLLAPSAKPIEQKEPVRPPQLLPKEEPEPGIVYIIPFVSVMVPKEVSSRVFDQFVDGLIVRGNDLNLQFVILKEGLQRVDPAWLAVRKYVTGELYAYVEEKGSTATDLRGKARLVYYRPYQETPGYSFEYPVTVFFDNDQSTLEAERAKLSDKIATALTSEFIKALQN